MLRERLKALELFSLGISSWQMQTPGCVQACLITSLRGTRKLGNDQGQANTPPPGPCQIVVEGNCLIYRVWGPSVPVSELRSGHMG